MSAAEPHRECHFVHHKQTVSVHHKQNNHGAIRDVSRSAGTLQKDWAIVKSFDLTEAFCIAVVGHEGWNNDPNAQVPYSLVVSFEAIETNVPIYAALVEVQVETEVEQQIESF